DWVQTRAATRLIEAAAKANRFDAAVTAYVALALKNPASVAKLKPALPDEQSTYLDSGAEEINKALTDRKISDASRQVLLSFLLDIQRARKDTRGAGATAEQLMKLNAGNSSNPSALRAIADLKLAAARKSLAQHEYDKAVLE